MTLEDEERMEMKMEEDSDENLVNVDGTKVKFSEKILKHAEEIKRKSMQLKIPKDILKSGKRKRAGTGRHCDYLDNKTYKPIKRRRTDPVITLSSYLESLLNELRGLPEAEAFLFPVNQKAVSNYYEVIKRPMDLQTIRENVQQRKYHSREEFLGDVNQIVENSSSFNGETSILTINSKVIMDHVVRAFTMSEERLMRLEKLINPLLDDNDQTALTYILDNILNEKIKTMQESWPFMKPVNKKQVKDYYERIKQPMDLETISRKIQSHKYHSRQEFIADMELIYHNSLAFNGDNSEFTVKAKSLVDTVLETLVPFAEHCQGLEANIKEAQKRAMEQAEMDSLGTSFTDEPETKRRKKKRHHTSTDFGSELSPEGGETGDLMDDLQYSSEEDDEEWDEVSDSQDQQGFTINVDQNALMEEPVFNYYPGLETGVESAGPVFNIQAGENGELYSVQDPNFQEGDYPCPPSVFPVNYQDGHQEEEVDENYDPTDFLQGLVPGEPAHTAHTAPHTQTTTEPGAGPMEESHQQHGDKQRDNLQDDLEVSDDSEEDTNNAEEDDPMAF